MPQMKRYSDTRAFLKDDPASVRLMRRAAREIVSNLKPHIRRNGSKLRISLTKQTNVIQINTNIPTGRTFTIMPRASSQEQDESMHKVIIQAMFRFHTRSPMSLPLFYIDGQHGLEMITCWNNPCHGIDVYVRRISDHILSAACTAGLVQVKEP